MNFAEHTISVFLAFFAIMNPVANTAVFAGLTSGQNASERQHVAARSLLIAFVVVVVFSVLGKSIFELFGITLTALRLTGGILIFLVGYHMLHGSTSKLHTADEGKNSDIAVSPLAVPLLAGPGTIATAMNYAAGGGWDGIMVTIGAFLVLCLITFVCFVFSTKIIGWIGSDGLSIITRLMGLILAVIGMQMLVVGISAVFALGTAS